jgi:hypothetical protein
MALIFAGTLRALQVAEVVRGLSTKPLDVSCIAAAIQRMAIRDVVGDDGEFALTLSYDLTNDTLLPPRLAALCDAARLAPRLGNSSACCKYERLGSEWRDRSARQAYERLQ